MDTNRMLIPYFSRPREATAGGPGEKKPAPQSGRTTASGGTRGDHRLPSGHLRALISRFFGQRLAAVDHFERDIEPLFSRELDQPTSDVGRRFARALLELRDGRLRQTKSNAQFGLRKAQALTDAEDCVHGIDISPTASNSQQPDCLRTVGSTYIVRTCQQNH